MWVIFAAVGLFALMEINRELIKVRKLLERQETARLGADTPTKNA